MTPLYRFAKIVIPPVFSWLYPIQCLNRPQLPYEKGMIVCANHLSNLDPITLGRVLKRQLFFMAKAELFQTPLMAWITRGLGGFPVQRGLRDTGALQESQHILERGDVLGIFPEGTRSRTGELQPGKPGAVIFSAQTGSPILPIAIVPSCGKYRPFRKTYVVFGDLIYPEESAVQVRVPASYHAAADALMARIAALQSEGRRQLHKK